MRTLYFVISLFLLATSMLCAAEDWLARVEPLLMKGEESAYRTLSTNEERAEFQRQFWDSRSIDSEEYARRVAYIDASYGTGKLLSGWNTDQGRVYLTLGEPHQILRLPESRLFYPMEIWRYRSVPEAGILASMDLLFFRRNDAGFLRLYSPTLDTIRALLRPNPSVRGMFPVNDIVTPNDLLDRLNVPPAEVDFAEAAINITKGVKGLGNDELLAVVTSPARALERKRKSDVQSRFLATMPIEIQSFATHTEGGGATLDLAIDCAAAKQIVLEILEGARLIATWKTQLGFPETRDLRYLHRAWLLPGKYTVRVTADASRAARQIEIHSATAQGEIFAGEVDYEAVSSAAPFQFGPLRVLPSAAPTVLLAMPPKEVSGSLAVRLRQGSRVVHTERVPYRQPSGGLPGDSKVSIPTVFSAAIPADLAPGVYIAEIDGPDWQASAAVNIRPENAARRTIISYNANLSEAGKWMTWAQQWAARRVYASAEAAIHRAGDAGAGVEGLTLLAKLKHLSGEAREATQILEGVLRNEPDNFDALATYGFAKASLGETALALQNLKKALSIRNDALIARFVETMEHPQE